MVFPRHRLVAAVLACFGALGGEARAESRSLYAIGNSLTASMLPFSIGGFASQRGDSLDVGLHTQSGAALDYLVGNPSVANIFYPVTLDHAFVGYVWTDLSLEPYPSTTSTLETDLAAFQSVMRSATAAMALPPRLFIYCAWPSQSSYASAGGFAAYWRSTSADLPTQPTVLKRDYFDHLRARLAGTPGLTKPFIIPIGDVLAALDEQIRAGKIGTVADISELYVDNDHLGDVGKFVVGATVYATLFKKNPLGLDIPSGYAQGGDTPLTPGLATQLESLVWQVVNSDARTGVNSAPLATSQELATTASTSLPITLAASDPEGSSLTYRILVTPAHGQLSGQAPMLTYVSDVGFTGSDSFSFSASDGGLESLASTISIKVTAPVSNQPIASTGGGGSLALWSLGGLAALLYRKGLRVIQGLLRG